MRNVIQRGWGVAAAKSVTIIAESYDIPKEQDQFEFLRTRHKNAYDYLMQIDPKTWRCTAWMNYDILPPRYGIFTNNASESANNMFKDARKGSWLYMVDKMLDITIRRNAEMKEKYKLYNLKDEVVKKTRDHIINLYNVTAGFEVLLIDEETGEFKVNRTEYRFGERAISHCVIPDKQYCTCGKWQVRDYPCIDGIAYFRHIENEPVQNILIKHVSQLYNCRSLFHLYKKNIKPVIISTLLGDGKTLGPNKRKNKTAGRPKVKRIRFRSKFERPEDSTITCKLCTRRGHNKRGCPNKHLYESTIAAAIATPGNANPAEVAAEIDPGYARNMM